MDATIFASVTMMDSEGSILGEMTVNATYPLGMPINVGDTDAFLPNKFASAPLVMTGTCISELFSPIWCYTISRKTNF